MSGPRHPFALAMVLAVGLVAIAQDSVNVNPVYAPAGTIPLVNVGGGYMESRFAALDFAQKILDEQNAQARNRAAQNQKLIDSGTVSVLDLSAPSGAVREFNTAGDLMQKQKPKEALVHLQKSVKLYNKFVSAHHAMGLAYEDLDETNQARAEFETAVQLDPKFAGSLVSLGRLELGQKDFDAAQAHFSKAAALRPSDAGILAMLAYGQYCTHQYVHAAATAERVHKLEHKGLANVHYVAAASAIAVQDWPAVRRELQLFAEEDPENPLAAVARQNLEILSHNNLEAVTAPPSVGPGAAAPEGRTFPNSDRLKAQLAAVSEDADDTCADCASEAGNAPNAMAPTTSNVDRRGFTFSTTVDEVAVFFTASSHGHFVSGLQVGNIKVLDAAKPPAQVVQFAPQSKLPLRLGLLIDTSGSLHERFAFEQSAAQKFLQEMMNPSDAAFVLGFSNTPQVTQDFTADLEQLSAGIQKLKIEGGTALFDAISYGCWKLAAYPDHERVANVLVVLTDGEDNSSHTSLRQVIRDAETTGVTVYTISTVVHDGLKTDADKVLIKLAETSGGEALFPDGLMLGRTFHKLHDIIRSRYMVAYRPADFVADGSYRTVRIIAEQNGEHLRIRSREGYHARLAAPSSDKSQPYPTSRAKRDPTTHP